MAAKNKQHGDSVEYIIVRWKQRRFKKGQEKRAGRKPYGSARYRRNGLGRPGYNTITSGSWFRRASCSMWRNTRAARTIFIDIYRRRTVVGGLCTDGTRSRIGCFGSSNDSQKSGRRLFIKRSKNIYYEWSTCFVGGCFCNC